MSQNDSLNLFPLLKFSSNISYFAFQAKGKAKSIILTYKTLLNRYFTVFINKNIGDGENSPSQKNLRCVSFALRLADENGAYSSTGRDLTNPEPSGYHVTHSHTSN